MYQLNHETLAAFPVHFSAVKVKKEREIKTFSKTQTYLDIQFDSPLKIPVTEESIGPTIDILADGDKALSSAYQAYHAKGYKISAGLRWVGNPETQSIDVLGLVLTVSSKYLRLSDDLVKPLVDFNLIKLAQAYHLLVAIDGALSLPSPKNTPFLRLFSAPFNPDQALLQQGRRYIQENIAAVGRSEGRTYSAECATNYAYEDLSQVSYQLNVNEKRIWLLKDNFEVVLGIKNAYQVAWGYHGIHDAFDEKSHHHINWKDRLGHPSLLLSDAANSPAGVYYAGHLAQRDGYLEVLNNSGRFDRSDLSAAHFEKLEAFLALQFQKAFGGQKVVFVPRKQRNTYDADYFELSIFFRDQALAERRGVEKREYTPEKIAAILREPHQEARVIHGRR